MPDKRSTLFIKQVSGKMLSNVTPDIQIKMSKKVLLKIKELARRSLVFIPKRFLLRVRKLALDSPMNEWKLKYMVLLNFKFNTMFLHPNK